MKLKDNDDNKISPQLTAVIIGTCVVVFIILLIVLVPNLVSDKDTDKTDIFDKFISKNEQTDSSPVVDDSENNSSGINSPSDLDFWDLYPAEKEEEEINPEDEKKEEKLPEEENDPSTDGKHTLVTLRDGSEEWVVISQYLPKHDYNYSNLVLKNEEMQYYVDGALTSFWGVDISKYQSYIDFNKVKKAGIDFVMIRVGTRGYGTGQIIMDDYFSDNIKRATDAGLEVGVYFSSQAISKEEAVEEAQVVIDSLVDYHVSYPVVFDMGFIDNDTARIEGLSKATKTDIAKAFLETIHNAGYTAMIYGDKEWLIKEIDMSKLTAYDVWLSQNQDLPDYPYKFTMWQYKNNGTVDGISGYVNLNISFVDYTEK